MELRFATLADWAGPGASGKVIVVGMFDTIYDQQSTQPIPIPPSYLFAVFEARVYEGSQIECSLELQDLDGRDLIVPTKALLQFASRGPGRTMRATVVAPLLGIALPKRGEYVFRFRKDGELLGTVPVFVVAPPEP
jgi:hypothetical protein